MASAFQANAFQNNAFQIDGDAPSVEYIGSEWFHCDRCGFQYRRRQLRKEWNGLLVCNPCWEPRHPQDFVRGVPDRQLVRGARPEPEPVYVGLNEVQPGDL